MKNVEQIFPYPDSKPYTKGGYAALCINIDQMRKAYTMGAKDATSGMPEGMKWVNVSDRYPEIPPKYYDKDDECYKTPINVNVLVWDGEDVYEKSFGIIVWDKDITHWMPLPTPPSDAQKK